MSAVVLEAPKPAVATGAIVEVDGLRVEFEETRKLMGSGGARIKAVQDVSLAIEPGETLGLVGESGSGKTTLGKTTLRLIEPTAGKVRFRGRDLSTLSASELRALRTKMQIVFQDPQSSLNPRMRILDIVGDALLIHGLAAKRELPDRVAEILRRVELSADDMRKYPHQFSGGQRQRIGVARALILNPEYVVLDEPVSALDVSIQAQIINLLADLRAERGLTYLFIAHDMGVIANVSTRIAVMYLGRIMEIGTDVVSNPRHPYTKALMEAVPRPDPARARSGQRLEGDIPSPSNPPSGCVFRTRCPIASEECARVIPELKNGVACIKV
jgi:peptide/nickel transport system ATP-binding protein